MNSVLALALAPLQDYRVAKSSTYVRKEESGSLDTRWNTRVRVEVYNPNTLAWEAQTTSPTVSFPTVTTATCSNVASSVSNVTLLASNSSRHMASFFNDSTSACYLKFGATASTSSFTIKIAAAGYYELPIPIYTGQIDGIWDTANGSMRVTEY